jgi:hypothetical protein
LLALAEVKGYAMLQFSYLVLRLSNSGNYTLEADLSKKNFDVQVSILKILFFFVFKLRNFIIS